MSKSSDYRCEYDIWGFSPCGAVVYWSDVIINKEFINWVIDMMCKYMFDE